MDEERLLNIIEQRLDALELALGRSPAALKVRARQRKRREFLVLSRSTILLVFPGAADGDGDARPAAHAGPADNARKLAQDLEPM